jgi:predicted dehydrogenase
MLREKPVRVGIVGCGGIAQLQHIPSLLRINEAEIVAICDRDEAQLSKVGAKLRKAKFYDDFGQMLSQERLELVDICTPPQTHAALCIQAAESGCHILVEKPAALTVQEFDKVAETCASNRVKLCQIQNKMFEPVMMRAMGQVAGGDLGVVMGVNIQVLTRRAALLAQNPQHWSFDLPAGVFTEILPHTIYLTQSFLGVVEPVRVHVKHTALNHHESFDTIEVITEGANGLGAMTCSGPSSKDKTIIDIHGTRKNMRIDLFNSTQFKYGTGGSSRSSRALENLLQVFSLFNCTAETTLSVLTRRFHSGHFAIIRSFVQSIRNNTDAPVSMEQAREVIRVLEGITLLDQNNVKAS